MKFKKDSAKLLTKMQAVYRRAFNFASSLRHLSAGYGS